MKKEEVRRIEARATKLMDTSLYNLPKKLSILYYYILEDANFHTLNNELTRSGAYGKFEVTQYVSGSVASPKSYGTKYAEALFKDYRRSGGRTWEL